MSGLEALAVVIPQSGRGLTRDEIDLRLQQRGVNIADGRISALLFYLVGYGMVEKHGDRYVQAKAVKW
jgi:hypothetical protein